MQHFPDLLAERRGDVPEAEHVCHSRAKNASCFRNITPTFSQPVREVLHVVLTAETVLQHGDRCSVASVSMAAILSLHFAAHQASCFSNNTQLSLMTAVFASAKTAGRKLGQ